MKKIIFIALLSLAFCSLAGAQTQDKQAKRLAAKVDRAFSLGLKRLDGQHLVHGPLKLTIEYTGGDVEFMYRSFRNFAGMERWMKSQSHQPGFPIRTSGDAPVRCRKGVCKLDLVDNQMAHNHVFLTKVMYGYHSGKIYVKRLYIVFG